MRLFQDHLITTIAAAGILLTSANLQHESATMLLNQTRRQGGKAALTSFADVVSQDVRSMGSGVPTGEQMVLASGDGTLTFRGTSDDTAIARTIRYDWVETTDASGKTETRLRRTVDGVARGESPALSSFALQLLDANGRAVTAPDDARRVHVRAEVAMTDDVAAEETSVRRLSWETEFSPSNLARRNTESDPHPLLTANVSLTSF